uniref:non-specific serine/threonine protein kinase n=1 Tax=Meloidogyne incognita TaxID=6306 RepID=A0A914L851_MELIC
MALKYLVSEPRCNCQENTIMELNAAMTINDVEVRFEYQGDNIGQGNFGLVIHAYDSDNNKCFALKTSELDERTVNAVQREYEVLNYFNTLEQQQGFAARNRIIKMHEMKHEDNYMYFLLELGGRSLGKYYRQKVSQRHGRNARLEKQFLTNILKGAAQVLQQFHEHGGIHLDVKEDNFVIALDQNQSEPDADFESTDPIPVKLIDFNISVIAEIGHIAHTEHMADAIKAPELLDYRRNLTNKADVWSFGLMALGLFNNNFKNYLKRSYHDIIGMVNQYRNNRHFNGTRDKIIKVK